MIRQLLSRFANREEAGEAAAPGAHPGSAVRFTHAAAPEGTRLIAVGDIHGQLALLHELMARLEAECSAAPVTETHLIFLGDYIDRGPSSAETVDWLAGLALDWATPHFLRGNHEQCFLAILNGTAPEDMAAAWLDYGGRETLYSYGLGSRTLYSNDLEDIYQAMRQAVPEHHRRFLEATRPSLRFGDYLFAHAGVRPGVPVAAQTEDDLLWIREPFLSSSEDFGAVVVHGHTITLAPQNRRNRIGIDTGAYRHGVLTAVVLEGCERRFVTAQAASHADAGQPAHQIGG